MYRIVCATRGGVGSRAVQTAAIERAKAAQADLVFLYIIDTSLSGEFEQGLAGAVRDELRWMGRAILRVAEKRAVDAGLTADVVIREGIVDQEVVGFLRESGAALLMLGTPREQDGSNFGPDGIGRFAETIQAITGVAVEVVRPGTLA